MHAIALRLTVPVALAVLAACATPPRHESQTAPGVDLAAYRSFALGSPAAGDGPMGILDANIRAALRAELTRRGYVEAAENAELLVEYETATADRVRSKPVRVGVGLGGFGGNVGGSVNVGSASVESYREGRLVVHVIDAAKRSEVWYGTIAGTVDRATLDAAAVARVVALAMEGFPARGSPPP